MSFDPSLRTDILKEGSDLLEVPEKVRFIAQTCFDRTVEGAINSRDIYYAKTSHPSKDIVEAMDIIGKAMADYQSRLGTNEDAKVVVSYEKPDVNMDLETVTFSLERREPGAFSQGRPMEGKVKNRQPILREVIDDPDNPGYKRCILGFFYDNILRLTCWARTAKQANLRALWIEDFMDEYRWFFTFSGINKVVYEGRGREEVYEYKENRFYGRPIEYYVRTEKIRNVSQKTLEQITVNLSTYLIPY